MNFLWKKTLIYKVITLTALVYVFTFIPTYAEKVERKHNLKLIDGDNSSQVFTPRNSSITTHEKDKYLTLEDVLKLVEMNHPKLEGAERQKEIASAKRLQKQGAFDPFLKSSNDYIRYNTPSDRGNASDATDNDISLNILSRSGVKLGAGARYNRGQVKFPLSPTGNGGEYYLDIKAPLLRGLRVNKKSIEEKQAFIGEPLADANFFKERMSLLLSAAGSYWDWVAAKKKVDVAISLLELAKKRAQIVEGRYKAGDLPEIVSIEANGEVLKRQENLVKLNRSYQNAVYNISLFLWGDDKNPKELPESSQVPSVVGEPRKYNEENVEAGVQSAIDNRPELKALNLRKEITELNLTLAKNELLPQIDFIGNPGFDSGKESIGLTLKAGVEVNAPFRRRTAKGKVKAAELKLEKLSLDQKLALQQILIEVKDIVSEINAAYERYKIAEQEMILAKKLEEGEREKFRLGDSTLFLVNQRERSSAEAQVKLIELLADYKKAVAIYNTATAQI